MERRTYGRYIYNMYMKNPLFNSLVGSLGLAPIKVTQTIYSVKAELKVVYYSTCGEVVKEKRPVYVD